MATSLTPDNLALKVGPYRLYRDFFSRAERKRRWSLEDDIPWMRVNRAMDPVIADVGGWLLKLGQRTDEQMADLEADRTIASDHGGVSPSRAP